MTEPGGRVDFIVPPPRTNTRINADRLMREVVCRYDKLVLAVVRSFRLQEADAHDAVQNTWMRLAENAHRVQVPERLGGWLVTTARHECLRILRHAKPTSGSIDTVADTVDPSAGPEQQAIDADTARTLWSLVEELPPRQQALLRVLFTDPPRPYREAGLAVGIPLGAIGPTRARVLRQLRLKLDEAGAGVDDVQGEPTEGDRTGSYLLDNLLDKAEQALREKLEPKVSDLEGGGARGTGDTQLDDLMQRADAALRVALRDHRGNAAREIGMSWSSRI